MAEVEGDSSLESLSRLLFQDIFSLFWCHCQQPLESLTNLLQSLVTEFENRKIVDDRTQIHCRRPSISVSKIRTFVPLMLFLLSNNVLSREPICWKLQLYNLRTGRSKTIPHNWRYPFNLTFRKHFQLSFTVIVVVENCWYLKLIHLLKM